MISSPFFDMSKPIGIGADHAGFGYKQQIIQWLNEKGHIVKDFGFCTPYC